MRHSLFEIMGEDVARARSSLGREELEFGEKITWGFCLRVRKQSMSWSLRVRLGPKYGTWRIGDALVMDVDTARQNAREALL